MTIVGTVNTTPTFTPSNVTGGKWVTAAGVSLPVQPVVGPPIQTAGMKVQEFSYDRVIWHRGPPPAGASVFMRYQEVGPNVAEVWGPTVWPGGPIAPAPTLDQVALLMAQLEAMRADRDAAMKTAMLNAKLYSELQARADEPHMMTWTIQGRAAASKPSPLPNPEEEAKSRPDPARRAISARSLRPWPGFGVVMGGMGMGTGFRLTDQDP